MQVYPPGLPQQDCHNNECCLVSQSLVPTSLEDTLNCDHPLLTSISGDYKENGEWYSLTFCCNKEQSFSPLFQSLFLVVIKLICKLCNTQYVHRRYREINNVSNLKRMKYSIIVLPFPADGTNFSRCILLAA